MNNQAPQSDSSESKSLTFFITLSVLTTIIFLFVTLPVAEAAIVCVVLGPRAYFQQGVRITTTRPAHFTTGELVPPLPSAIIAFLACFLTMWIVGVSLNAVVQFLQKIRGRKNAS